MFAPVTTLVLALITSERLLVITPPFAGVKEAYVHYHFSNVPQLSSDEEKPPHWPQKNWLRMEKCVNNGIHGFMANLTQLKEDDMFLLLQYRFIFPDRGFKDSDWKLHIWNSERLNEYFHTCVWWIIITTLLLILLIASVVIYVLAR